MSVTSPSTDLDEYGLGGVDCPECNNTGRIVYTKEDGTLWSRECRCMAKRRTLRRIRNSGLGDMMERYTFESYDTPDEDRKRIKQKAQEFVEADSGWMYIAGRSGSGKTHICTAICRELIDKGHDLYYMNWKDESTVLKASVMDSVDYEKRIQNLKKVRVLYIDDFLKGGSSAADIRLAFEIINARYNNSKLRTIISSEVRLKALFELDEALGGRIYERSRGCWLLTPDENWRYRMVSEDAKEMRG